MTDKPVLADPLPAKECHTMMEVRAGVDAIDSALVTLLAQRFAYMDAAARIKTERRAVRDEVRKAKVIENVTGFAAEQDVPTDVVRGMWELLVESSIAYELDKWDRLRR
jgi:isochorismate pyruvate lyase